MDEKGNEEDNAGTEHDGQTNEKRRCLGSMVTTVVENNVVIGFEVRCRIGIVRELLRAAREDEYIAREVILGEAAIIGTLLLAQFETSMNGGTTED